MKKQILILFFVCLMFLPLVNAQVPFAECHRNARGAAGLANLTLYNEALHDEFEDCQGVNRGNSPIEIVNAVQSGNEGDPHVSLGCGVPLTVASAAEVEAAKQAFRICLSNTLQGNISFDVEDEITYNLTILAINALVNSVTLGKFVLEPVGLKIIETARIRRYPVTTPMEGVFITNTTYFIFSDYSAAANLNTVKITLEKPEDQVRLYGDGKVCGNNFTIGELRCSSSIPRGEGCVEFYLGELYSIYPNTTVQNYLSIAGPATFGPFEERFIVGANLVQKQKNGTNFINFVRREGIPTVQIGNRGAGSAAVRIGNVNLLCESSVVLVEKEGEKLNVQNITLGNEDFLVERFYLTENPKGPVLAKSYIIHPDEGFSVLYKRDKNFNVTIPKDAKALQKIVAIYK